MIHPDDPIEVLEELVDIRSRKVHDAIDRTRAAQNELNAAIVEERMAHHDLAEARLWRDRKQGGIDSARKIMADYVEEFGGTVS